MNIQMTSKAEQQSRDSNFYVIYSVYKSDRPEYANYKRHVELMNELSITRVGFAELLGQSGGIEERSVLVNLPVDNTEQALEAAEAIRLMHMQDSVLVYIPMQEKRVISVSSSGYEELGRMQEVSREVALSSGGYSYRPDLDLYYVAGGV